MGGTQSIVLGDKGRLVVPAEIRARRGWHQSTPLILVETADGLLLTERSTALRLIRDRLKGQALVAELVEDRRRDAATEDSGAA